MHDWPGLSSGYHRMITCTCMVAVLASGSSAAFRSPPWPDRPSVAIAGKLLAGPKCMRVHSSEKLEGSNVLSLQMRILAISRWACSRGCGEVIGWERSPRVVCNLVLDQRGRWCCDQMRYRYEERYGNNVIGLLKVLEILKLSKA
ncbi:hypothetical protein BCR34DRAFT_380814 [Clohesyomyces aquaticus]|uniref:Uncharacterized protein n=1 Tax=Clohesyomyces aquaticus TaxID=1231657 RepID=A0A1Y2A6R5_9PLEO|nr:hypothetical protein BCR34DRAFT_380814 [Clohesyomyces aquaticus]